MTSGFKSSLICHTSGREQTEEWPISSSSIPQQAPAIVNLPTASGVNLNVDAVRRGAQVVREFLRRHVHDTLQDFDSERASRIYADLLNPLLERLGDKPMVSVFTTIMTV